MTVTDAAFVRSVVAAASIWLLVLPAQAGSQRADDNTRVLIREWLAGQRELWQEVKAVSFVEEATRSIDGPTGQRLIETVLDVDVDRLDAQIDWSTRSAKVDGEVVPDELLDHFEERWRKDIGSRVRRLLTPRELGMHFLDRMRPVGDAKKERMDGIESLRVDLVPTAADARVERVTLWFDEGGERLVRSRTILQPGTEGTSIVAETSFQQVDGLDVPHVRSVQGTVRVKRRMRRFTTLVSVESALLDYRFAR